MKPINSSEKGAKWEREDAKNRNSDRKYLKWAKNMMARARRRFNKKECVCEFKAISNKK